MEMISGIGEALFSWRFLLLTAGGALAGLVVGAIPGLTVTMATALLVSLTYSWSTPDALAMVMGVYVVGVYSGAISAILVNIPGAPSSVITTLDGYPLAHLGQGDRALKFAVFYSAIGSFLGLLALALAAAPLSRLALSFYPLDYFLLALFGLTAVGALTGGSLLKGWLAACLGLLFSCVGMDSVLGTPRLTLGLTALASGVSVVPALVGLFGLSEVLVSLSRKEPEQQPLALGRWRVSRRELLAPAPRSLWYSLIGVGVGALPGAGSPVASMLAYKEATRLVKHPDRPFGQGAVEGIVASEAANNACVGGALIPLLTLGVPGDAVTAVLVAVFQVHGLRPGPRFLAESTDSFYAIIAAGLFATLLLLAVGWLLAPRLARVVALPQRLLLPLVSVLCVVGAFACNNRLFDVGVMVFFGLLGWAMRRQGFPLPPLVLGLVLGGLMDDNLRRAISLASSQDSFLAALLLRPITLILLAVLLLAIVLALRRTGRGKTPVR